jgi:hypothetical protein
LGKSAHWGEKSRQFSMLLAGTIIAENLPEVRVLFFEARLIEQVPVPLNCGSFGLMKLPKTGDSHEKCSVLCISALRFDNRLSVMGDQGIEHSPQAECSN